MLLLNTKVLTRAARQHRAAATALNAWAELVKMQNWKSLADVRLSFPAADGVPVQVKGIGVVVATVFNVKGNAYRLITVISYQQATVVLREFLTHAEYSKDDWKGRL